MMGKAPAGLFLLVLFLIPFLADAATINAASCSYDDVLAAINSAQYEDIIQVPAGDCVWNRTLTITKGITLQGAGIDQTIIRSDGPSGTGVYAINFNADQTTAANDYPFRLSGFTIKQVSALYGNLVLTNQNVSNALTKVMVHDNKFIGRNGSGIGIVHSIGVFGVIYNNIIQDVSHAWRFLGEPSGWTRVEEWVPGTGNAMYYENNYIYLSDNFDSALIVSGGGGNRYVARYNTINLSVRGPSRFAQSYDIHGNQENNPSAGIGLEIYGNHRIGTSGRWIDQRGGQVFFFFNRWSGTSGTGSLNVWEEFNDDNFMVVACPEGSRYPRTAAGNCIQRPRGSYYWRNRGGAAGTTLSSELNILWDHYSRTNGILNDPLIMLENDGWFRDNTIAFDGTIAPVGSCGYYNGGSCTKSGVGCGTLAEMNAITPAAPGLGFWVTDQSCTDLTGMVGKDQTTPISGTLYRAEDDGQGGYEWVAHYTPYIYPHPLTVAPFEADICNEGQITSPCWCEGMKSSGYCCNGYYQTSECDAAETCDQYKRLNATTVQACSCNQTDVEAAVNAAQSEDTVLVPAGSCTWDNNLVITKGIYLIGAGIGQTVITSNYSNFVDYMDPESFLISYYPSSPASNEPCRISGLTINCDAKCYGILVSNPTIEPINKIRIDHTKILNPPGFRPASIYGTVYGVADNNEWHGFYMTIGGMDAATWNNLKFDFGTADNFYFEDNLFVGSDQYLVISSYSGARWCSRYNTYDGSACTNGLYPHLDAHGNQVSAGHVSVMGVEIYNDVTTIPAVYNVNLFQQRGGKALVYNNKIYAHAAWGQVREEENDALNPPASSPINGQPQHVSDSYWWSNKLNDVDVLIDMPEIIQTVDYGGEIGIVPQENREFWKQKSSFDGTVGVGVGLISARPTTCTVGVGYWANDTKTLYKCNATNTWIAYYTPYTYPHPLRTDCINYPGLCDSGSSPPEPVAGDLNGDGDVDIIDLSFVGGHFGQTSSHPQWNVAADVVANNEIDIYDVVFVASRFS